MAHRTAFHDPILAQKSFGVTMPRFCDPTIRELVKHAITIGTSLAPSEESEREIKIN